MSKKQGCRTHAIAWVNVIFPHVRSAGVGPPDQAVTIERLARDPELAMEIAIRMHDDEIRRRQSADTKAALYLAFLAAVLPVVGTLTPKISAPSWAPALVLDVILLPFALLYILMAGWYAAKALTPSNVVAMDAGDLSKALEDKDARARMAASLIKATKLNYPLNNRKITYIRLTQAHIFRAFLAIILIVAVDWGTDVASAINQKRHEDSSVSVKTVCSPLGLRLITSGGQTRDALRYHLPEHHDTPTCLPLSIAAD